MTGRRRRAPDAPGQLALPRRSRRSRARSLVAIVDAKREALPKVKPAKITRRRGVPAPRWQTPLPGWATHTYGRIVERWMLRQLGVQLYPWQGAALDHALACDPGGSRMAHRLYLVSCARQNGKSTAARALLDWIVAGRSPLWRACLGLAYDRVQALRLYQDVLADVEGLPGVYATLAQGIRGPAGCFYQVTSREARSQVRGLTLDVGVFDEVATHKTALVWEALVPTLATRPAGLVLAMSTAGGAEARLLRSWYERGVHAVVSHEPGPLGMTWYGADEDAPDDDPRAIAAANPSMRQLITPEAVAFERASMTRDAWRRERLNIWAEGTTDPGIVLAAWAACARPGLGLVGGRDGAPVVLAVDAPGSWSRGTIAVCGSAYETGLPHVAIAGEVLAGRRGSVPPGELLGVLAEAIERWQPVTVLYDGAGAVAPHIEGVAADRSWRTTRATRSMLAAAAMHLDALVMGGELTHSGDPVLPLHINSAVRVPTGEGWRWSRRASLAPIDALIAASLAVLGVTRPELLPTLQVF
jgi:phage terminase large subunit-like protein